MLRGLGSAVSYPVPFGWSPVQRKANLVHFGLKISRLVLQFY